jgi:transcriptional regulator with XRE-family HTH domain
VNDATPDPTERIAFGTRVKILRNRRGMNRETLAGLLGKSPQWLKDLESGRRQKSPDLDIVLQLAEVLRVRNLAELTGDPRMGVDLFIGPGHPRLAAVAAAIDELPLPTDRQAPPPEHLRARLQRAWAARHSAPNHRDVVGALVPGLIRDAQLAVKQATDAADRRARLAVLAEVWALAQFFAAYQPPAELLWRVVERNLVAAAESDDPHAIAIASWLAAQAHRDGTRYDAAESVNRQALEYLDPFVPDAGDDVLAMYGALQFEAGYTSARQGRSGEAWRWWDAANDVALRLPVDYYHPITSFSRAVMGAHATTVAVELHAGRESVRQARSAPAEAIPSRPRRARHRIEQARAHHLDNQPDAALSLLEEAHAAAPETIIYNGYARAIVLSETESRSLGRRERASELAQRMGMLIA